MAAEKGKRFKAAEAEAEEDGHEHIDKDLVLSIEKLQEIQDELEKVNEEASEKVLEVEQKYNEIRRPVYIRRNEIIQSISDFWLTAFMSHPALCDLLNEEDQKIFKYLKSLDVDDCKDLKSGYTITFNFSPNPYFEDTKLTKTYYFDEEGVPKITGTTIRWKDGMDIANGGANPKKGNKRPFADDSFFTWFSETQKDEITEGIHDEVAEIIKEDLWPNPLKYFNNEADEEEFDSDEEAEDDELDFSVWPGGGAVERDGIWALF
ncbi:unnamed protein product [Victoria cruziana]